MDEDSIALFATTHASGVNYTASALAIDITNLGTIRKALRLIKGMAATGETAPTLNITPRYLVVPATLETLALQVTSQITPALITSSQPNWIKSLDIIVEPLLDAATNGTTAWYLAADPAAMPGYLMAFLDGRTEPTMIQVEGTNILGTEWGVYLDCGVKCIEHRGWYRVRGA
jgi:hypothetical protein